MLPMLTLEQSRGLQEQLKEHVLQQFLSDTSCIEYLVSFSGYHQVFSIEFKEPCHPTVFASFSIVALEENRESSVQPIEISYGKILYIGTYLSTKHSKKVVEMIQK